MKPAQSPKPKAEANKLTTMMDMVLGGGRFDLGPVDVERLAVEYSSSTCPQSPIHQVVGGKIPGCVGALVFSNTTPRQWGIIYDEDQSETRRRFTIAHEFGHYILHRHRIESEEQYKGGIFCSEDSVVRGDGGDIETEADQFAATLLMPLHDFRRQISAKDRVDFEKLGNIAKRYGVSLTAAVLRWLEYSETRAMLVVSNEGFALWAKSSDAALKSGRFLRTKNDVYELPAQALAARGEYTDETRAGVHQRSGVWFDEPVIEMCLRSDRYDQELTLLQFESLGPKLQFEDRIEDVFDRFQSG
ncbi:ImmA/IrrE family metallo-endopeptidase [Rhizobium lemnae]|uniref:ImmA/IrrE family metallo-endopeptidase n=1 Tax=Rhizobium lemnae TaxID=1214924 RepID=A0ABV8E482_9HYPH|nr:ImmA/IrrE family metallo-endopeptidase [Rhizobium lemnae]MCJ8506780.1 ImmA/IrrE family metallo-endopeptidase [Rhizobium lemnae]